MDLVLGERAVERFEHRATQVEVVARELEVEERALPLLELGGGGEDVVGFARGLGHRDVDDADEVELAQGLAHRLAVGERVDRVARLDEHRPEAVGVIADDLLGDHVARDEAGDESVAGDGGGRFAATGLARAATAAERGEAGVEVHARP